MKKSLLAISALLATTTAQAENLKEQFFFKPNVGVDYGYSKADTSALLGSVVEDKFHNIGITAGARVHKNIGFEFSYAKSSEESKETATTSSKTSYTTIGADVLFYAPVADKLEGFVSTGIVKYDFDIKGPGGSISDDDIAPRLGVGGQYELTDRMALKSSIHHSFVKLDGLDGVNELKIGLRYSF